MSFCILYDVVSKIIMYNISGVREEGLLASRDLMPFERSLCETLHFDTDVISSYTEIIIMR